MPIIYTVFTLKMSIRKQILNFEIYEKTKFPETMKKTACFPSTTYKAKTKTWCATANHWKKQKILCQVLQLKGNVAKVFSFMK